MVNKTNIRDRRPGNITPAASRPAQNQASFTANRTNPRPNTARNSMPKEGFALEKKNIQLILIGLGIIVFGFILMSGSENKYGFMKTGVATIVVLAGFIFEIYAIMYRRRPNGIDDTDMNA